MTGRMTPQLMHRAMTEILYRGGALVFEPATGGLTIAHPHLRPHACCHFESPKIPVRAKWA